MVMDDKPLEARIEAFKKDNAWAAESIGIIADLQKHLERLGQAVTDLKREAAAMAADYLVRMRQEEAKLQTDINGWRCKYQRQVDKVAELTQMVADREEAIRRYERECNDSSQALEQLQQSVAAREETILLWERKCTEQKERLRRRADTLVQHVAKIETLEAKVRTQKVEISELHRVRSELEFNQNIKTADRTDLQADNDRLLKAEQEYMAEVAELKQTLANTQARDAGITRGLHAKINSLELDIATLQTRMRDRDRVIKRLTNSLIKLDHEELVKEAYNTAEDPSAVPPCWASTAQTQKWQEQRFAMFSRALANMLSDNDAEDYVDDVVELALEATEKGMKAIYANASPLDDVGDGV